MDRREELLERIEDLYELVEKAADPTAVMADLAKAGGMIDKAVADCKKAGCKIPRALTQAVTRSYKIIASGPPTDERVGEAHEAIMLAGRPARRMVKQYARNKRMQNAALALDHATSYLGHVLARIMRAN